MTLQLFLTKYDRSWKLSYAKAGYNIDIRHCPCYVSHSLFAQVAGLSQFIIAQPNFTTIAVKGCLAAITLANFQTVNRAYELDGFLTERPRDTDSLLD